MLMKSQHQKSKRAKKIQALQNNSAKPINMPDCNEFGAFSAQKAIILYSSHFFQHVLKGKSIPMRGQASERRFDASVAKIRRISECRSHILA